MTKIAVDLPSGCAVAVAGVHDAGAGGGASVAHRAGWRAAIRRRCAEIHALHRAAAISSPDAASPSPGLNVLAAVRAIETLREEPSGDADAPLADAAAALAPVTADADAVSDAMLAAVASLLRLGTDGEFGSPEDVAAATGSLDAFAAAFASLCARAAAGLRAETTRRLARRTAPFLSRFTSRRRRRATALQSRRRGPG